MPMAADSIYRFPLTVADAGSSYIAGTVSNEIGLGSARDVPLARARELAGQARAKLAEGINPKDARKPTVSATFGECADRLIEAMRPSWRSSKHAQQWEMTMREYAAPLRRMSVDAITTDGVLTVLKPLWHTRPETASRVRARIERVLEAAKAQGLRKGDNPARWRGHLNQQLAKRQKVDRPHQQRCPMRRCLRFWRQCVSTRVQRHGAWSSSS